MTPPADPPTACLVTWLLADPLVEAEVVRVVQDTVAEYRRRLGAHIEWRHFGHEQLHGKSFAELTNLAATRPPHLLFLAPSCSTWSRARQASPFGPKNMRSFQWPWGLPWLSESDRKLVEKENEGIRSALGLMELLLRSDNAVWMGLTFPEDLGQSRLGRAASIWQLTQLRTWASHRGLLRSAFHQCRWGTSDSPRPTGLLLSHAISDERLAPGWPTFSPDNGRYVGPLPAQCGCQAATTHRPIVREHNAQILTSSGTSLAPGVAAGLVAKLLALWASSDLGVNDLQRDGPQLAADTRDQGEPSSDVTWPGSDQEDPTHTNGASTHAAARDIDLNTRLGLDPPTSAEQGAPIAEARTPDPQVDQLRGGGAGPPPTTAELHRAAAQHDADKRTTDSDDTSADSDAAPAGSGPQGSGDPMWVGTFEKRRPLCDGAGLCSPGRWPPHARPRQPPSRLHLLNAAVSRALRNMDNGDNSLRNLFLRFSTGQVTGDPFPQAVTQDIREYITATFDNDPINARPRPGDRPQVIGLRLLQALMREAADPDAAGLDRFGPGVRLGVGSRLPRTPAVYAKKRRWKLQEQYDPEGWQHPSTESTWRDNYRSAELQADEIDRQLRDHAARGMALRLTPEEASRRFPGLKVSSLGAVIKPDPAGGPPLKVRIVLDATHGVRVNDSIRVRDQDRGPTASDIKRLQREQALEGPARGLAVDIRDAHRIPQIDPRDWAHQACRARPADDITIYCCGVFGIASISYWWSRLGGALVRTLLHAATPDMRLWIMLLADDLKITSTSDNPERVILWALWVILILGFPISWEKSQGGSTLCWVGYELLLREHALGLSEARAAWCVSWLRRLQRDGVARMGDFRAGLGRLAFACGALEYERPFLAPLYSFASLHKRDGTRPLPLYVLVVLEFLAERIAARRHYPSAIRRCNYHSAPRVDAKAEGSTIGLGGWLPTAGANGEIQTSASPWFAFELSQSDAPWAYARNGQPFRAIASLEALAVLTALIAFGDYFPRHADGTIIIPGITDNRGNRYAVTRLQSSRYPLCAVVMEIATQLELRGARLELSWAPRELNTEADALSNGVTSGFDDSLRIEVNLGTTPWIILNRILDAGQEFEKMRLAAKEFRHGGSKKHAQHKRAPLRETDPW